MVGFWSTLSLNMPDFTRFGRSQREQVIGQVVALPTTMTVFAAMGVMITSASAVIYGERDLGPDRARRQVRVARRSSAIAMFTVVVATLAVNIAANVVSPANDFANLVAQAHHLQDAAASSPASSASLMMPWKLIADPRGYIFDWLVGYSGGLGSIAGVLVVDYWIVRKKRSCSRICTGHRREAPDQAKAAHTRASTSKRSSRRASGACSRGLGSWFRR